MKMLILTGKQEIQIVLHLKNEVTLTLKEAQVINRLTYKSRNGCKGFANNFSIYIPPVSSGNNFQK